MLRMLKKRKGKKGQSTIEYVVLIMIVIGVLISIQVYIKRAVQGRMKSSSDDVGDQYSPGNTNVFRQTHTTGKTRETASGLAGSRTTFVDPEVTTINATMNIINVEREYWGDK